MTIEFWWRQIFEILIFHKSSLGSLDVPQKIWARSVQPFWRLLDTNKQTDTQTPKQTDRQAKFIYRLRTHIRMFASTATTANVELINCLGRFPLISVLQPNNPSIMIAFQANKTFRWRPSLFLDSIYKQYICCSPALIIEQEYLFPHSLFTYRWK